MKLAMIGVMAAAAAVLCGCKSLGLTDEATKDWSGETTRAGGLIDFGDPSQKVRVVDFKTDFKSVPPKAVVTLKNEGESYAFFSVDVEFGFAAPPDSFAPYIPDFQSIDLEDFKKDTTVTQEVIASPGQTGAIYFAKVSPMKGADVRMTTGRENSKRGVRRGTVLLRNRVEVVAVESQLDGAKPSLKYTLQNVDEKGAEIGNLKYMVQFYKDGKLLKLPPKFSFFRPAAKPLGKGGETVVIEIAGLEDVQDPSLAGARPVLRVKQ